MKSEFELSAMWPIIVIFIFGTILHTTSVSGSFLSLNFGKKDKETIWHYFLSDVIFPEKNLDNCMINFYIDPSTDKFNISALIQLSQHKFRYSFGSCKKIEPFCPIFKFVSNFKIKLTCLDLVFIFNLSGFCL